MTTPRLRSILARAALIAPLWAGCAGFPRDSNSDQPSNGDMAASPLTVSPTRISIKGGDTIVVDAPGLANQAIEISQSSPAVTAPLGTLDGKGHLSLPLSNTALKDLALGQAEVRVKSDPTKRATIRLFLTPTFPGVVKTIDIGTADKKDPTPVWVGIASKRILTLNYKDTAKMGTPLINQVIGEFVFDGTSVMIAPSSNYNAYSQPIFPANAQVSGTPYTYTSVGVGQTNSSLVISDYEARSTTTPSMFRNCLTTNGCAPDPFAQLGFSRVTALTADRVGSLFAFVATDTSTALRVFSDNNLTSPVTVNGGPTATHDSLLALGLLDDDTYTDMVMFTPTGTLSVFLRDKTQGLVYKAGLSSIAQMALANAAIASPSALTLGDVDGDGLDDLAVASGTKIALFMNLTTMGFSSSLTFDLQASISGITSIAVGEISASGKLLNDVAVTSKQQKRLCVIENSSMY